MGIPQNEEPLKLSKVHANTGRSRVRAVDRYLDDDRREIARETWQDFLEMLQDALRECNER